MVVPGQFVHRSRVDFAAVSAHMPALDQPRTAAACCWRLLLFGRPRGHVSVMRQSLPKSDHGPMSPAAQFHPAVAAWFAQNFAAPTAAQAQAWPAIQAGRHVLIAAPTGSGKTLAAFLAAIDALVRQGLDGPARGRDAGRLRLAAEGALERHPAQSGGAARRHPRGAARARTARCRDPHLGAHRRHAAGRARPRATHPAAHRRDHAGVALHPARLRVRAAPCSRPRAP